MKRPMKKKRILETQRLRQLRPALVPWIMALLAPVASASLPRQNLTHGLYRQQSVSLDQREKTAALDRLISITVDFEMSAGDEGMLVQGGNDSESYSLEVRSGRLIAIYKRTLLDAIIDVSGRLPTGPVTARYEFGAEPSIDA